MIGMIEFDPHNWMFYITCYMTSAPSVTLPSESLGARGGVRLGRPTEPNSPRVPLPKVKSLFREDQGRLEYISIYIYTVYTWIFLDPYKQAKRQKFCIVGRYRYVCIHSKYKLNLFNETFFDIVHISPTPQIVEERAKKSLDVRLAEGPEADVGSGIFIGISKP